MLPLPALDPSVKSYIVVMESSRLRGAVAREVHETLERTVADDVVLTLLTYSDTLKELGLMSGDFAFPQTCRSCRIVSPRAVYQAEPNAERWGAVELPEAMADLLVPDRAARCDPCPSLSAEEQVLPAQGTVSFGTALDDQAAIVGTTDGVLWSVRGGASPQPLCAPGGPVGLSGLVAAGRLWIMDGRRLLSRSLASTSTATSCAYEVMATTSTGGEDARWLAGGEDTGTLQIFAASDRGALGRFDDQGWHPLGHAISARRRRGGLAWLGADRAVAAFGTGDLSWLEGDRVTQEQVETRDPLLRPEITSVARSPTLGVLLGTGAHGLVRRVDGTWRAVAGGRLFDHVHGLVPFRDGALMILRSAVFLQFSPRGQCETQTPFPLRESGNNPRTLVRFEGDVVLIADVSREAVPPSIAWLRTPPHSCPN
ncbi:MAG: hypothetical protein IT384_29070 [Deltaproteobacteria bacterium]|nr:hypothetical protein [Deltaproteobacteria bacterium]